MSSKNISETIDGHRASCQEWGLWPQETRGGLTLGHSQIMQSLLPKFPPWCTDIFDIYVAKSKKTHALPTLVVAQFN